MTLSGQFSKKDNTGTVTAITRVKSGAHDVYLVRIRPPAGFTYEAGQYVDIGFGKLNPRSYSIANAPGEGEITIHIKRTQGETGLFLAAVLKVGDTVTVSDAQGDNTYNPAEKRPILAIAGGMGFTPLKAVVEAALRRDQNAEVHLFWGTNAADEQYMRDYFEDMADQYDNFHFHPVAGTPVGQEVMKHFVSLANFRIYVAGPPPMISAIIPLLLGRGAERAAISYDRQLPRTAPGPSNDNNAPS